MLVPSVDISQGRAVQLVGGRRRVLEDPRDPVELASELGRFGPVAAIDLDAARGTGDNLDLLRRICGVAQVRAGGGVRNERRARSLLAAGADRVIIGTAALKPFVARLPRRRVQVALDHSAGEVLSEGWRSGTGQGVLQRAGAAAEVCGSYLVTFVDSEGTMEGLPTDELERLRDSLPHPLTVAGGVGSSGEASALIRKGLDVQVGMSLYTGRLSPVQTVVGAVRFDSDGLAPTVARDRAGRVLMLAWSSPESLRRALSTGRGVYYSRSREEIWMKGETSGNTQELLACRTDCDSDAVLFVVSQSGPACHTGAYSCFDDCSFSLSDLESVIASRRGGDPPGSYTGRLLEDPRLLRSKLLEEAGELAEAGGVGETAWEAADLLYFIMVALRREGVTLRRVIAELAGRRS
jgi:phosphoribosyl-ATP pyrophosphohydrolase